MTASARLREALPLIDTINESHRRIKALSDLVGVAVRNTETDHEKAIDEAMAIVWELAGVADSAADDLFECFKVLDARGIKSDCGVKHAES